MTAEPDIWDRLLRGVAPTGNAAAARFCTLLDQLPVAVYACEPDGRIGGFNREAVRIWGRAPGRRDDALRYCGAFRAFRMDGEPLPPEHSVMAETLRTGLIGEDRRVLYEQPSGLRLVVHERARPVRDAAGRLLGGIGVLVPSGELSGQSLLDDPLQATAMVRIAPAGIFRTDAAGRCCFVNDRWCEIVGMDAEVAIGDGWVRALHPDDRERVFGDWQAAVGRRQPFHSEYRFLHGPSGRVTWVVGQAAAELDAGGRMVGYVGVITDVSEQKRAEAERLQLEAQVQQAQKMESLGVLAGGIAHDFNNLLTSMLGYAGLAQARLPAESPARSMLREIEQAAQRAAELTRQLLDYSGRGRFEVQPLRIDQLVSEMAQLLLTVIGKKATLQLELQPAATAGDATQIRQVIMNLITNASDAVGDAGGVIDVRSGVRVVAAGEATAGGAAPLPAGSYAFLRVQDHGCGMDGPTQARIFEPFFTTKFAGRGLGLAAVLGIVRGHRGSIRIDSEIGRGSTFEVLLPATPLTEVAEPPPRPPLPVRPRGGTVLLVDDEASVRTFVAQVLREAGFEVVEAEDGVAALAAYARHRDRIQAVLLDLTMPRMDGREVLRHLRASQCTVPVLVMSGYSDADVAAHCQEVGAAGFVGKPLRASTLLQRLAELLPA